MATETKPVPAPPRSWLRIALVVSLTVNVLMIGLAVGTTYKFRADGGPPRNYDLTMGPLGTALDSEARRDLGRTLSRTDAARPLRREERGKVVSDMAGLLLETPFNPIALEAMLDRQRQHWSGVQESAQAALVAHIAAMTPEARAVLAERLMQQADMIVQDGARDNGRGD